MRWRALTGAMIAASLGCGRPALDGRLYPEAEAQLRRGNLREALAAADRGWQRWRFDPGAVEHWRFRTLKADVLIAQGEPADALALMSREVPAGREFREFAVRRLMHLGYIHANRGRYAEARQMLDQAYADALPLANGKLIAEIELRRAVTLTRVPEFALAEASCARVLEYAAKTGDEYFAAAADGNLSYLMLHRSRFDEAVRYAERGLESARRAGAHRFEGLLLGNLGRAWRQLGDPDRAAKFISGAYRISRAVGDTRNHQIWTGNLGELHDELGQRAEAVAYYREALAAARRVGDSYSVSQWLNTLSSSMLSAGDIAGAARANAEDLRISAALTTPDRRMDALLQSARIAETRGELDGAEQIYRKLAGSKAESARRAVWAASAYLANLLKKTGRTDDADAQYRLTLAELERTRGAMARAEWRITFQGGARGFYNDYIDFLISQRRDRDALAVAEASRAQVLGERVSLPPGAGAAAHVTRFQQLAREANAILVSFWLAPQRSFAWIVTPATIDSVVLPPESELKVLVETYAAATAGGRDPLETANAAGRRLTELLLWPVLPKAPPGSRVVIVPDGSLHLLNFETLPLENPRPHYWIEDVTLAVVPSLALAMSRAEPVRADSLLLIGDPRPPGGEFPKLPGAADEVARIRKRLNVARAVVHTGADANPLAYLKGDPGRYSLVHFAAHAAANRESPLDSAVVLSASGGNYKLYARDILALPLRARLVTLSACLGAGTRLYGGEGLVGFSWAFLHAGAQNVIAGLWEVNDASTAALMGDLYGRLAAGEAPAPALRGAKLSLLRSGTAWRRPYYWAPFQVFSRILPFQ